MIVVLPVPAAPDRETSELDAESIASTAAVWDDVNCIFTSRVSAGKDGAGAISVSFIDVSTHDS
jgi:hypothetical protein